MAQESKMIPIPAGSLLTITSMEYYDYYPRGVFRATHEIDAAALWAEWLSLHPEQAAYRQFGTVQFLTWVARKGLIEPVDCIEWHLSDSGNPKDIWVEMLRNEVAEGANCGLTD